MKIFAVFAVLFVLMSNAGSGLVGVLAILFVVWVARKFQANQRKLELSRRSVTFGELRDTIAPFQEKMSGVRCWQCGEHYVGLAGDCACTNWGR